MRGSTVVGSNELTFVGMSPTLQYNVPVFVTL